MNWATSRAHRCAQFGFRINEAPVLTDLWAAWSCGREALESLCRSHVALGRVIDHEAVKRPESETDGRGKRAHRDC